MLGSLTILLVSFPLLFYLLKLYLSSNHSFWPKRGVPLTSFSEVASFYEFITKKKTVNAIDHLYYLKGKAKNRRYCGFMEFRRPVLMVTDLDLIKQITIKDFDSFVDRRSIQTTTEPLFNEMVVSLRGQKWKDVRSVLSPAFTTGKMKLMFEHFNRSGKRLETWIKTKGVGSPESGYKVIVQNVVSRFTVDVIGATAFGFETNALKEEDSEFFKMVKRVSTVSFSRITRNMLLIIVPRVFNLLRLRLFDKDMMQFFTGILAKALKARESSSEKRNDFLQLLVEVRKGELKAEDDDSQLDSFEKDAQLKVSSSGSKAALFTDSLTMAQSFVFFLAGFDTVGGLISFAVYLMAAYPEIQEKIYEEVKPFMDENNGEIDYEDVGKLEYLDMFISEIMRRYPPAIRLERQCVQRYKVPESDLVLEPGQLVAISVQGIHLDPEYYPNPEKFDPERFTPENKAKRHASAYIPFGMGPRNCIGMRFALIETKVGIAYLAYYFRVQPTDKTPIPITIDKEIGFNRPIANLEVKFVPRC